MSHLRADDDERVERRLEVIATRVDWLTAKLVGNPMRSTEAWEWDKQLMELLAERRQLLKRKGD